MRIGVILSPVADVGAVLDAARAADEHGLDAVGLWDHYHSARPEWGYVAGWSAHAALAGVCRRAQIVPMVINNLHYQVGVLAKETSILSRLTGGRFELAIGAGDWPASFSAWNEPFPDADERIGRLEETVAALRELWQGGPVTVSGRWVSLREAICAPAPAAPPRVVVGVGGSRRTLHAAARFADELNVYANGELVEEAATTVGADGTRPAVSVFLSWEWDAWPTDPAYELERLAEAGAERALVSIGACAETMVERVRTLSEIARAAD